MKKILLIAFIFFNLKAAAQHMIYLADGYMVPGKIFEITKDSVRFKNLANPGGPFYSYAVTKLQLAFNAKGNYLIFNQALPFSDKERDEFIGEVARPRPVDIVVDATGKLSALTITNETENEISGTDKGKDVKLLKDSLDFVIRKNGRHELFSFVDRTSPYLVKYKLKIDSLVALASATSTPIASTSVPTASEDKYFAPDMAFFGLKAQEKIHWFTDYLQAIMSVNSNRAIAVKSIDLACDLFLNKGKNTQVEVSSTKTAGKKKYLLRDYLNRLMIKSGQFDKVEIEYAGVNYASRFRWPPDGGYYATVSFVQKLLGFNDGNLVYGEQTKRNIVIAPYRGEQQGGHGVCISCWDVYLDDIGIVETIR